MSYLLVINQVPPPILADPTCIGKLQGQQDVRMLVLTQTPEKYQDNNVVVVACDLTLPATISKALEPYIHEIVGVFSTGETNVQYLQAVIPLLPKSLRVASVESLAICTNKRAMREAFMKHYPEITPQFIKVQNGSDATITELEQRITYPVIIKPASLASSMLIRVCRDRQSLQAGLQETFAVIADIYQHERRQTEPEVIVEEYLEGELYSIDAYATGADETVYVCPPVYYMSNKQRGWDDFSLYKRVVPTTLSEQQIAEANATAIKAIRATGLTYSSAHVELIFTNNGWKIIELGPRIGRYRHRMYAHAYGINHYLNDIRIHLGLEPIIPDTLQKYCAAYSIYPEQEGILQEITGLDYLQHNPAIASYSIRTQPGELCKFAKNGGKIVVEFYVVSEDKRAFDDAVSYVEQHVNAITR